MANCRKARVMHEGAATLALVRIELEMLPVSRVLPEEANVGLSIGIVHLADRVPYGGRRPVDSRVRHNGQEFVDA